MKRNYKIFIRLKANNLLIGEVETAAANDTAARKEARRQFQDHLKTQGIPPIKSDLYTTRAVVIGYTQ